MQRIIKFETEYRSGRDPVDKVLLAPGGAAFEKTRTWHRISDIRPPQNIDARLADSQHYGAMLDRWSVIEPAYEAWKKGQELPENGTPLAVWSGVTAAQADHLRKMAIYTVEDVTNMDDASLSQCKWPQARQMPKLAADFLSGADTASKDAKIAEMSERIAAMEEMLAEKANPAPAEDAKPKRGPGRPKKQAVEAA